MVSSRPKIASKGLDTNGKAKGLLNTVKEGVTIGLMGYVFRFEIQTKWIKVIFKK